MFVDPLKRAYRNSTLVALQSRVTRAESILRTAYAASALATVSRTTVRVVRQSYIVRWLTAEPQSETVVIDLRETRTIGPLLTLVDRAVPPLHRRLEATGASLGGSRLYGFARQQPVRAVSLLTLVVLLPLTIQAVRSSGRNNPFTLAFVAVALLGTRVRCSWATVTDSRTYRALAALFAPPDATAVDSGGRSREDGSRRDR